MGINEDIADELLSRGVDLNRYAEALRLKIMKLLLDLRDDIAGKLLDSGLDETKRTTERYRRQEAILRQTERTIATAFDGVAALQGSQMREIAEFEASNLVRAANKIAQFPLMSVALTPGQFKVLASDTLVEGAPSRDWWAKQSADTTTRFKTQVRIGVAAGETNDQIVRRIRGSSTGRWLKTLDEDGNVVKRREFVGGVIDATTREATAMVRTSVQAVAQETRRQVYKANDDVLRGWAVLVTLDGRTCLVCIARSGGAWDFEGNPLPESPVRTKFPGRPPWHWQDRCQLVPVVKTFEDILGLRRGTLKLDKGTQASIDGQVPRDMTYEDWLKTKPESFQREVLGPGRFDLWKAGKITATQLADAQGNELTLEKLRAKSK